MLVLSERKRGKALSPELFRTLQCVIRMNPSVMQVRTLFETMAPAMPRDYSPISIVMARVRMLVVGPHSFV